MQPHYSNLYTTKTRFSFYFRIFLFWNANVKLSCGSVALKLLRYTYINALATPPTALAQKTSCI